MLNPWVLGGSCLIACLLCATTAVLVWMARPEQGSKAAATAVLNVIEAPPMTATPADGLVSTDPTLTAQVPPSPPPGVIAVGAYVQISGTGGEGLRLRFDPGLNGEVHILGSEAEVFRVDDGPREADGYTWWYLVGPFDETRYGWAVANYLSVIQNP